VFALAGSSQAAWGSLVDNKVLEAPPATESSTSPLSISYAYPEQSFWYTPTKYSWGASKTFAYPNRYRQWSYYVWTQQNGYCYFCGKSSSWFRKHVVKMSLGPGEVLSCSLPVSVKGSTGFAQPQKQTGPPHVTKPPPPAKPKPPAPSK